MRKWHLRTAVCVAAIVYGRASIVAAQEQSGGVETIVVTAEKRAQNLQDTPISISALTAGDIQDAGIGRLEDVATSLPNVYFDPRELRSNEIVIRGISADTNDPGLDQSVGFYVDGVYMGRATTINTDLFGLQRIEVLRGPQGTLYGRNTIGGAVNIITQKPTDEFIAESDINYGNYNAVRANALVSGPVMGDSVFASAAVSVDRRDGFGLNTASGIKLDNLTSVSGRGTIVIAPQSDWDFTIHADFSIDNTHSEEYEIYNNGALAGSPFSVSNPWSRTVDENVTPTQHRDIYGVSGEFNWRFGGGELTSITAFRTYTWNNIGDDDYTVLDYLSTGIAENQHQFSQEVRYASDASLPLSYVAGAYYFHQILNSTSTAIAGVDFGVYPHDVPIYINGDVETDSYAAFGQLRYRINSQWAVNAGLRYTEEPKSVLFSQQGDPYAVFASTVPQRTIKINANNISPSATLEWHPSDDAMLYATFSEGFKSGGFDVFSITKTDNAEYRPEKLYNYEAGAKTQFLDDRLRFNGDLFYMQYEDLQENQLVTVNGLPEFITTNASKAKSEGVELALDARPIPELDLSAAYGYLDASFQSYANATPAGANYSGNALPWAPRNNASFAAEWKKPLGGEMQLVARGDTTFRSRIYFASDNAFSDGTLALINARLGIGTQNGAWTLSLWGRNLTNARYVIDRVAGAIVPGQVVQAQGTPLTFGAELSVKY